MEGQKDKISLERTKFIDVHMLIELVQKGKLLEILVLSENDLISSLSEFTVYGKIYNLPFADNQNSLFIKIFKLQKDLLLKKVNPRIFNQEVKKLWL